MSPARVTRGHAASGAAGDLVLRARRRGGRRGRWARGPAPRRRRGARRRAAACRFRSSPRRSWYARTRSASSSGSSVARSSGPIAFASAPRPSSSSPRLVAPCAALRSARSPGSRSSTAGQRSAHQRQARLIWSGPSSGSGERARTRRGRASRSVSRSAQKWSTPRESLRARGSAAYGGARARRAGGGAPGASCSAVTTLGVLSSTGASSQGKARCRAARDPLAERLDRDAADAERGEDLADVRAERGAADDDEHLVGREAVARVEVEERHPVDADGRLAAAGAALDDDDARVGPRDEIELPRVEERGDLGQVPVLARGEARAHAERARHVARAAWPCPGRRRARSPARPSAFQPGRRAADEGAPGAPRCGGARRRRWSRCGGRAPCPRPRARRRSPRTRRPPRSGSRSGSRARGASRRCARRPCRRRSVVLPMSTSRSPRPFSREAEVAEVGRARVDRLDDVLGAARGDAGEPLHLLHERGHVLEAGRGDLVAEREELLLVVGRGRRHATAARSRGGRGRARGAAPLRRRSGGGVASGARSSGRGSGESTGRRRLWSSGPGGGRAKGTYLRILPMEATAARSAAPSAARSAPRPAPRPVTRLPSRVWIEYLLDRATLPCDAARPHPGRTAARTPPERARGPASKRCREENGHARDDPLPRARVHSPPQRSCRPLRRAVASAPMRVSLAGGGTDLPPFVPGVGGRVVGHRDRSARPGAWSSPSIPAGCASSSRRPASPSPAAGTRRGAATPPSACSRRRCRRPASATGCASASRPSSRRARAWAAARRPRWRRSPRSAPRSAGRRSRRRWPRARSPWSATASASPAGRRIRSSPPRAACSTCASTSAASRAAIPSTRPRGCSRRSRRACCSSTRAGAASPARSSSAPATAPTPPWSSCAAAADAARALREGSLPGVVAGMRRSADAKAVRDPEASAEATALSGDPGAARRGGGADVRRRRRRARAGLGAGGSPPGDRGGPRRRGGAPAGDRGTGGAGRGGIGCGERRVPRIDTCSLYQ